MLQVFRDAGFEVARELEGGEIEVRFPIAATETYRARVDERDHARSTASLRPFFAPGSVAVDRRLAPARLDRRRALPQRARGRLRGRRLPRQPRTASRSRACAATRRSAELPEVRRPRRHLPARAAACSTQRHEALERGRQAPSASSPPASPRSAARASSARRQLLALVRAHGARLVGPNCLGIAVPPLGLNATFAPAAAPARPRSASRRRAARSGSRCSRRPPSAGSGSRPSSRSGTRPTSPRTTCSSGGRTTPTTDVVLLYLESFGNPRKFARIARRVARRKPILALKAGTTSAGARAASSHTAALAGSDAAVDALFQQAGVLRARTLEELVDAAALLSTQPLPRGRARRRAHQRGRPRDSLRGRLRGGRARAAGARARRRERRSPGSCPSEASLANPIDMLGSATAASVRAGAPAAARGPAARRGDRALRPAGRRRRRRGRRRDPRDRRGRGAPTSRCSRS